MIVTQLQFEPLDVVNLTRIFTKQAQGAGAVVSFTGSVRDYNHSGKIDGIELEHYPGMTEKALSALASETLTKFECSLVSIVHRVGKIENFEPIVWVSVASAHRKAAFNGAMYSMDALKQRVPLWKKEWQAQHAHWVEAKQTDNSAFNEWFKVKP